MRKSFAWLTRPAPALCVATLVALAACGDSTSVVNEDGGGGTDSNTPTADNGGVDQSQPGAPIVDIRADNNRNGVIDLDDPTEDENEDSWDNAHGAIFLANIDDDNGECPLSNQFSDVELAACHDGSDNVINGAADLEDLARLKTVPWPDAPEFAVGLIQISNGAKDFVRLFKNDGSGNFEPFSGSLTSEDIRQGVELGIEAKDIVRDRAAWDGFVDITYKTNIGGTDPDVVRMRVAPLLTSHHLQPATQIYGADVNSQTSTAFVNAMNAATNASGVADGFLAVSNANVFWGNGGDQWTQDYFETGYMTMPAPNGEQKIINVFIRSANVFNPQNPSSPLRFAGRFVFAMRGVDTAAIQEYDINHSGFMDSLNSYGNFETVPPHSHNGKDYPLGRVLRGKTPQFFPDPKFTKMIDDQGVQDPIDIDTSWLLVGHVDETTSFVKSSSATHGWVLLANDPAMAISMLEAEETAGNGDVPMFVGKFWVENQQLVPAQATISEVLADPDVMASTAEAVVEVQHQVDTIKQETGITDQDIVPVPFTHWPTSGFSVAYQPGHVNGMLMSDTDFAAPETHGPEINGVDIFKADFESRMTALGVTVHWIEDWDLYHRLLGEVHCGTNALRQVPTDARWWEVIQ